MIWSWTGVMSEDGTWYFIWFDWISNPKNRLLGYQRLPVAQRYHYFIGFWWFCICWSLRNSG
jgi:hypothetical protein